MLRYARHPDLRLTALEGEGVALHLGTRRYYSVSESGLDILEALAAPRTLGTWKWGSAGHGRVQGTGFRVASQHARKSRVAHAR